MERTELRTFGLDIMPLAHSPAALRSSAGHPPMVSGVVTAPVMMPMPDVYDIPMRVKKRPIPTPLAILMVPGIILTSQWRMPVRARNMKIQPSINTAVRATR